MTENDPNKPQATEEKELEDQPLPSSGEGSASIVARLQIQRELSSRPRRIEAAGDRPRD